MDLDSEVESDDDDEEEEDDDDDGEGEEGAEGAESGKGGEGKTTTEAAAAMVVMLQRMIGNDALGRLTNMAQEVSDGKISLDDFQVSVRCCLIFALHEMETLMSFGYSILAILFGYSMRISMTLLVLLHCLLHTITYYLSICVSLYFKITETKHNLLLHSTITR